MAPRILVPVVVGLLAAPVGAQGRVVITEIMYNPASVEDKGQTEWVEIANIGDAAVEITDWKLDDEDSLDWGTFSCVLPPGGVVVLINRNGTNEQDFRKAWDIEPKDGEPEPPPYLVIPVTWGSLANRPDEQNEILQVRNDRGEVVCEVNFQSGGLWPSVTGRGGPSIALTSAKVVELNDGRGWMKSEAGKHGARASRAAGAFSAEDIGSPGTVAGLDPPTEAPRLKNGAGAMPKREGGDSNRVDF